MLIDPLNLQEYEKDHLDEIIGMFLSPEQWEVGDKDPGSIIQVLKVFQGLLKLRDVELEGALHFLDDIGVKHDKTEKDLLAKVSWLEQQCKVQNLGTGPDNRFLRDEISQLESQLEQREKEFSNVQKEMGKEKKLKEELVARAEEAEDEVRKLKREVCDTWMSSSPNT